MGLTVGRGVKWGAGADFIEYQASPGYQTYGVEINRTGVIGEYAYASRSTQPTGLSSSGTSQFILSFWLNPRTLPGTLTRLLESFTAGGSLRFRVALSSATSGIVNSNLLIQMLDSSNRTISLSAGTSIPCGSWSHVIVSSFVPAISANRVFQCYINNAVSSLSVTPDPLFSTISWDIPRTGIFTNGFAPGTLGQTYFGNFAEFYFAPTQYLDLSVTSNLRKFITTGGGTPDLGSNAATPTGTSPTIYFKGPTTSLLSGGNWVNYGTGGNWTASGTNFTYNSLTNPPSTP